MITNRAKVCSTKGERENVFWYRFYYKLFRLLDEDIPYIQYPSKHHQQQQQQQQQEQEQQQHQQQQQQITVDDPVLTNNNPIAVVSPPVDISAPHVVKLPSDEPMTTSSIVVPLQPPLVPGKTID